MASDEDTAAGLIAWLNSLDVANKDVQTITDLVDGAVMWRVLRMFLVLNPSTMPAPDPFRTNRLLELPRKTARRSRH